MKFEKDLKVHQVQPLTKPPSCQVNNSTQCQVQLLLGHFQGRLFYHFPGHSVSMLNHLCWCFTPDLNESCGAMAAAPSDYSGETLGCVVLAKFQQGWELQPPQGQMITEILPWRLVRASINYCFGAKHPC